MATITIPAPATRRTVVERRPVAPLSDSRRALGHDTATLVIPSAATAYASSGLLGRELESAPLSAAGSVRLTARGRRLARAGVVLVALLAALAFSVISHSTTSQAGQGAAQSGTSTVVVQPGQTLWGVARALTPDADVRETVARIQELNGLTGASVHPGQSLIVPAIG